MLICSSTDTHCDMIIRAARAGKEIFCEKPIDLSPEKIQIALEEIKKAGVRLQVGFNRRFDHNYRAVYNAVQTGKIRQARYHQADDARV